MVHVIFSLSSTTNYYLSSYIALGQATNIFQVYFTFNSWNKLRKKKQDKCRKKKKKSNVKKGKSRHVCAALMRLYDKRSFVTIANRTRDGRLCQAIKSVAWLIDHFNYSYMRNSSFGRMNGFVCFLQSWPFLAFSRQGSIPKFAQMKQINRMCRTALTVWSVANTRLSQWMTQYTKYNRHTNARPRPRTLCSIYPAKLGYISSVSASYFDSSTLHTFLFFFLLSLPYFTRLMIHILIEWQKAPMCLNNYRLINKSNKIHDLGVACGAAQSNREQTHLRIGPFSIEFVRSRQFLPGQWNPYCPYPHLCLTQKASEMETVASGGAPLPDYGAPLAAPNERNLLQTAQCLYVFFFSLQNHRYWPAEYTVCALRCLWTLLAPSTLSVSPQAIWFKVIVMIMINFFYTY